MVSIETFNNYEISNEVKTIIEEEDNDLCDICMVRVVNKKISCSRCKKSICSVCLCNMKDIAFKREAFKNTGLGVVAYYKCAFCRKEDEEINYHTFTKCELYNHLNNDYIKLMDIFTEKEKYEKLYNELLIKQMKIDNIVNKSNDEMVNYLIEENINKGEMYNDIYNKNIDNEKIIEQQNNKIMSLNLKQRELTDKIKELIDEQKRLMEFNNNIVEANKKIVEVNNELSGQAKEVINGNKQNLENVKKIRNILEFKEKPHIIVKNLKNLFKNTNFNIYNGSIITTDKYITY